MIPRGDGRDEPMTLQARINMLAAAVIVAMMVLAATIAFIRPAHAVVCAKGVYRAGCAGPHGAVVAHRPVGVYGRPVARAAAYGAHCYWRAGVRVCR